MNGSGSFRQQSLFEDIAIEPTELVRVGFPEDGNLSPLQKKINAQARKIEKLREGIREETRRLDEALLYWGATLAPIQVEVARRQVSFAFALESQANGFKLGSRQRQTVGDVILGLLDDAFSRATAEAEDRELYTRWSDTSFDEEMELQTEEMLQFVSEMLQSQFGVEIDEETILKGPEAIEELLLGAARRAEEEPGRKARAKTKKQIAKEERERLAAEYEQKSLRSLYLSLAKVLHPDAERDEAARGKKETIMKELTSAYEAGDLHTMLRIEQEWLGRESTGPLPEEKLEAYLSALQEQTRGLQEELEALPYSPRYAPIQDFLDAGAQVPKDSITTSASEDKRRIRLLDELVAEFSSKMEKQRFIARVREIAEE